MDAFRAAEGWGRLITQQCFLTGYGGVCLEASWCFKIFQDARAQRLPCSPLRVGVCSFGNKLHYSIQDAAVPRRGSGKAKVHEKKTKKSKIPSTYSCKT